MCAHVYLVVGKIIVQRIFQFTKELLFFLLLSFFSLLEDRQLSKSVSVILTNNCICDMKKCTFKNNNKIPWPCNYLLENVTYEVQ